MTSLIYLLVPHVGTTLRQSTPESKLRVRKNNIPVLNVKWIRCVTGISYVFRRVQRRNTGVIEIGIILELCWLPDGMVQGSHSDSPSAQYAR
jgi:hypothetical protein